MKTTQQDHPAPESTALSLDHRPARRCRARVHCSERQLQRRRDLQLRHADEQRALARSIELTSRFAWREYKARAAKWPEDGRAALIWTRAMVDSLRTFLFARELCRHAIELQFALEHGRTRRARAVRTRDDVGTESTSTNNTGAP